MPADLASAIRRLIVLAQPHCAGTRARAAPVSAARRSGGLPATVIVALGSRGAALAPGAPEGFLVAEGAAGDAFDLPVPALACCPRTSPPRWLVSPAK